MLRERRFRGVRSGLLAACLVPHLAAATAAERAEFGPEHASREVRHVADWVVHAGDNRDSRAGNARKLPFVVIDKREARVFVFDAHGRLRGAAAALLGLAAGDHAVPGIGTRKLSSIRPAERTTPAGRFLAALGNSTRGEDVLWVDYEGAVSMHRVIPTKDRLRRLATPSPSDNRVSYGCINIPVKFYESVVRTSFAGTHGIVYVLPESRSAREVFASYDVENHSPQQSAGK